MTARLWTSLAVLLTLLLAACGGGGGGNPDSLGLADNGHHRVTLDYGGFSLVYDCDEHTALRYDYTLQADTGSATRPTSFTFDPAMPADCAQQSSTATYASVQAGWDRGHLVTSNHMDYSDAAILHANHMSNIVPQVASFNQNIWVQAENVAECWRDISPVRVVGGVVYGSDAASLANDYFVRSHGIRTPDWFWKVVVTHDVSTGALRAIAWIIPNQADLLPLDSYLVSISQLQQWLNEQQVEAARLGIDWPAGYDTTVRPATTWPQPANCQLG